MSNHHNDEAYEALLEDAVSDRAEEELRNGDVGRFWEVFGPDGVCELFDSRFKPAGQWRTAGDRFTEELRSAIANYDAKAVGQKVLDLMWGVYEIDSRDALEAEEWRPFGWERCDE